MTSTEFRSVEVGDVLVHNGSLVLLDGFEAEPEFSRFSESLMPDGWSVRAVVRHASGLVDEVEPHELEPAGPVWVSLIGDAIEFGEVIA
jgi:hypothetical protein